MLTNSVCLYSILCKQKHSMIANNIYKKRIVDKADPEREQNKIYFYWVVDSKPLNSL